MRARLALAALAFAGAASALETAQWPPPGPVEARMRELQQVIASGDATMAERNPAREELAGLLRSPAGRERPSPRPSPKGEGAAAARAAIEPYPSVVKPLDAAPVSPPAPSVAQVEVVLPPKPVVIAPSGAAATPSGRFAVDPRTGNVLHETPGGYIDPRTGQFLPR